MKSRRFTSVVKYSSLFLIARVFLLFSFLAAVQSTLLCKYDKIKMTNYSYTQRLIVHRENYIHQWPLSDVEVSFLFSQ